MGEGLCRDVWRTCVWLCGAARVWEEMFEDSGFPVGRKDCGTGSDVIVLFLEFRFPESGFVILGKPKLARVHYNLSYMKYLHFYNLGDSFCSDVHEPACTHYLCVIKKIVNY